MTFAEEDKMTLEAHIEQLGTLQNRLSFYKRPEHTAVRELIIKTYQRDIRTLYERGHKRLAKEHESWLENYRRNLG